MANKKYHIITMGCQMNISDSERIASRLEEAGYKKIYDKYGADLVIVNTCGVRQSAENRIYGLIPKIKKESANRRIKTKIVLTGCLAERKDVKRRLKDYVDVWTTISQMVNSKIPITTQCQTRYLEIKPKYESNFFAFVPIGNGCDNFCSYCVVPYARGREVYRPAKNILNEVRRLVKNGYKEITLIAQNVNSYKSGRTDFADLLKAVNNIKGDFWVRFLTSHPKDMSEKLIKTMAASEKACRQIYLPVQAGDNGILKAMNRKYTVEHYKRLIKKIRQAIPDISITTDLIVGFPGETKKQFNNSLKLFKQVKFDMAYISAYSARPGTAAFKLSDNVTREEKKNRKNQLDKILRLTALANNKKYIGKIVEVLINGRDKAGNWVGQTRTGKDVKCQMSNVKTDLSGKVVRVRVTGAKEFCLAGILINNEL